MIRRLWFLLFFPILAFAQTQTAVTGTITDPNSVPYYPATVTACLSPVTTDPVVGNLHVNTNIGANYCIGPVATAANGSFAMNLWPNANIAPAATTWNFTVATVGTSPQAGNGAITFTVTGTTISGSTQSMTAALTAAAPTLLRSGSGSSAGSSINVVNVSGPPYNTPLANVCANSNVSFSNASNQITCSTYTFTSANLGQSAWATCCGGAGGALKAASVMYLGTYGSAPPTITSIISAHVVQVSANTSNSCSSTSGCLFFWGSDGTTQMQSALTVAYAGPGSCPAIQLPAGIIFVSQGLGNSAPVCTAPIGGATDTGLSVIGQGRANSLIVMMPNFNWTTCTGNGTQPACFFGVTGIERKYFGIWGGEISNTGTNSKAIITASNDDFDWDLGISGIGASDTALIGYQMEAPGAYPQDPVCDGAGVNCIVVQNAGANTGFNMLVGCYAGDTAGLTGSNHAGSVWVKSGASLTTHGCMFGPSTAAGSDAMHVSGTLVDVGSVYLPFVAGTNGLVIDATGVARVDGMRFVPNTVAVNGCYITAGGFLSLINSQCVGLGSGGFGLNGAAGGNFRDLGSNSYQGTTPISGTVVPSCTFSTGGGGSPSCAIQTGSTNEKGVIIASAGTAPSSSGTITLTFAGTFSGATGTVPACTYTIDNSGTAWGNGAVVQVNTQSATAPTLAWLNVAAVTVTALTASVPYRIDYTCTTR